MPEFQVVIIRDVDGLLMGEVPSMPGCVAHGKSVEDVKRQVREHILMALAAGEEPAEKAGFVGVETVQVEKHED